MSLITKAIDFANKAHEGQKRKLNNLDYILHPLEVGVIISTMTNDEEIIAAGILHDTIEDCGIDKEDIRKEFGNRVYEMVVDDTEIREQNKSKEDTWKERKLQSLNKLINGCSRDAKMIWLADKLSNMRSIYVNYQEIGNDLFNQFHQKDPKEHKWYYETILANLSEFKDEVAYRELRKMIEFVFGNVDKE